ncbi:MAG: sulfite exporter TauE/SafE family protein [Patescibacteria group bacterium]
MLKKIKFHISGIHCRSCKTLIETEIDVLPGVNKVEVDYKSGEAEVEFDEEKIRKEKIFSEIRRLNYQVKERAGAEEKEQKKESGSKPFLYGLAFLLAAVFLIEIYLIIQKLGGFSLLAKLNEGNIGYGLIFVIGLLAGFHCIGMCGGLVVSYSASHLKRVKDSPEIGGRKTLTPHWQYNAGRFISYTVIGGILGGIGSFFGINPIFTGIITLGAGVFMILMGLSFISNWQILEKIKPRTPQFIARFLYNEKHSKRPKGPFIIGLLNGFMPCGPLQAMQLYALASGSVTRGAISMAVYVLGTIPLMFGFGVAISSIGQQYIKRIVKVSGILVIILGLFMANRGLTNFGYGFNSLSLKNNVGQIESPVTGDIEGYQTVKMEVSYSGYKPNTLYIKKGVPVRWIINVKQLTGCNSAIMIESLGIKKNLEKGENIIEFTPPEGVSEIKFSCGMRMIWGKFVISDQTNSDNGGSNSNVSDNTGVVATAQAASTRGASGGGCGCGGGGAKIQKDAVDTVAQVESNIQLIKSTYTASEYLQPNSFKVKAGTSVKFTIDVKDSGSGCGYEIMIPGLYDKATPLQAGQPITMEFTPTTKGSYDITCGMGMINFGTITVE